MASRYPTQDSYTAQREIRIVIVGRTGSGKSATGNTILGKSKFVSERAASSVTRTCEMGECVTNNTKYQVIDTPGIFDTKLSKTELAKEVVKCVNLSSPGPHLFLLVIFVARFTAEEVLCFEQIFELFGERLQDFSLIVFTGKDLLGRTTIEKYIGDSVELRRIIERCRNKYIAINNMADNGEIRRELENLLKTADAVIESNRGKHYTNEMFKEAEKALQLKIEEMKKQQEEKQEREREKIRKTFQVQIDQTNATARNLQMQLNAITEEKQILEERGKASSKEMEILNRNMESMNERLKEAEKRAKQSEKQKDKLIKEVNDKGQTQLASEIAKLSSELAAGKVSQKAQTEMFMKRINELENRHNDGMKSLLETNQQLSRALENKQAPEKKGCIIQ